MIVSASFRTDLPAFYGAWLLGRLRAGFADVASPYRGRPYRVSLDPRAVDGIVFWTKNPGPFVDGFEAFSAAGHRFVVQHSITALPRAVERSVPAADTAVAQLRGLSRRYGAAAAVWRFDPIAATTLTPPAGRRESFARLARALSGAVDEVVLSWVQPYRKTARNLDRAAAAAGFAWRDPPADEKRSVLRDLAAIAAEFGIAPTLCAQPELADAATEAAGLRPARCIDAERLSRVADRPIAARTRGNRPGCLCAESRDIGGYDTCPMGCAYCYAVRDRGSAAAARDRHDPEASRLAAIRS